MMKDSELFALVNYPERLATMTDLELWEVACALERHPKIQVAHDVFISIEGSIENRLGPLRLALKEEYARRAEVKNPKAKAVMQPTPVSISQIENGENYQLTPAEIEDLEKRGFGREEIDRAEREEYSYEDWLDPARSMGPFMGRDWGVFSEKLNGKLTLSILPEIERQKIIQRQAEVFRAFEDDYTKALIEDFERYFIGSKEGKRLIEQKIKALKKLLFEHKERAEYHVLTKGLRFTLYTFSQTDKGSMYYWYDSVCVKNLYGLSVPSDYVFPHHCSLTTAELAASNTDDLHFVVAALACERFKKYLNAKLLESEPPALAAKILTETDCFFYETKLFGIPPSESDLAAQNALGETLSAQQQAGKIVVKASDRTAEGIIKGALKIGLTQGELNVFLEKFAGREYGNWHSGTHFDLPKKRLNTTSILDEIFGIASSFDNPALGDYFLKSAFDEVQSVGDPSYSSTILVFSKQFNERMAERNAAAPTTVKAKAARQPRTFQSLFKGIPEMEQLLAAAVSVGLVVKDGGGYAWIYEGAKSHRVCALWFAAVDTGLTKEKMKNKEATTLAIKHFFGMESLSKDTIGQVNRYNEEYKAMKAALEKKLRSQ